MRSGKDLAQLGLLARGFTSSASVAAVPAVAPSGLLSFLGGGKRVTTPLSSALHGVDSITPASVPSSPPSTELTTLPNGVRVAAQDVMSPLTCFGIFVGSGSIHETPVTSGASHLLQEMAFRGTKNRTPFMCVRSAEAYGVQLAANVSREQTVYYATAPRNNAAAALEILCDAVINPSLQQHILDETVTRVLEANKHGFADPKVVMAEGVVSAAYTGALARPLYYSGVSHLDANALHEFHAENYTPGSMVLAAAGASLPSVKALASDYLSHLPRGPAAHVPESKFVGGSFSDHTGEGAHCLVAFECDGWNNIDGCVMATVAQYLLGGGQDFSSGGPGKGMHSRLYQNVLTRCNWITSCAAYGNLYDHTGLLGIMASTPVPQRSADIVDVVCNEFESVSQGLTRTEVERAKRQALSSVHQALEYPQIVCEDIGRQVLSLGQRVSLSTYTEAIAAIDETKMRDYFRKLIGTKPAGVLLGDQALMPKFDAVKARFS